MAPLMMLLYGLELLDLLDQQNQLMDQLRNQTTQTIVSLYYLCDYYNS
jgi:hypothetical protein